MFEQFEKDTVGYFSTWTVKIGEEGFHKFGYIDVRSVLDGADRELVMQACKDLVDRFCEDEMRSLGKIE